MPCRRTGRIWAAFEERVNEPLLSYEELLKGLKKHGKL